jgi:hypothetical protein
MKYDRVHLNDSAAHIRMARLLGDVTREAALL